MKRLGGIWPQVVSFENLLLAYRKARRGKARSPGVARFALDLERDRRVEQAKRFHQTSP